MNDAARETVGLARAERGALVVGASGLAACLVGGVLSPAQLFRSWLVGYLFWIAIALGSLALLMLHHMVGGNWGYVIRRQLEAATRTLPLMAALAAPLVAGIHQIYSWSHPGHVSPSKSLYLNVPFFVARTAIYFAAWMTLAFFLNRMSREQDRTGDPGIARRLQLVSGPGLVVYGLTVTFASVDWVMSLEPHWFSTIYGMLFMVGQALTTLAFVIAALWLLAGREPLAGVVTPGHFHDLGNLMLAFVMLWAYLAVSQFLIIWSGNLPEEIPWYLARLRGGWQRIALVLVLFHFAAPFLLLLQRGIKKRMRAIGTLALAVLALRLVDLYWMVAPAFHPTGLRVHWLDLAAPAGIGGLWVWFFLRRLQAQPMLPLHDPRFSP